MTSERERQIQDKWWRSKTARELDPVGIIGPFVGGDVVTLPKPKSRALVPIDLYRIFPGGIDDLCC